MTILLLGLRPRGLIRKHRTSQAAPPTTTTPQSFWHLFFFKSHMMILYLIMNCDQTIKKTDGSEVLFPPCIVHWGPYNHAGLWECPGNWLWAHGRDLCPGSEIAVVGNWVRAPTAGDGAVVTGARRDWAAAILSTPVSHPVHSVARGCLTHMALRCAASAPHALQKGHLGRGRRGPVLEMLEMWPTASINEFMLQ